MRSSRSFISGSFENRSRDMSEVLLVSGRGGHFDLPDLELPVEVGKLAARVLQKELSLEQEDGAEYVEEQNGGRDTNPLSVRVEQDDFVGRHELQLAQEPEAVGEKESDRDEERVGNHVFLQTSRGLETPLPKRS